MQVRLDPARPPAQRLAALAGVSVFVITLLEGTFDAVLLLPAPAIIVWAAVGALIPDGPTVRTVEIAGARKSVLMLALVLSTGSAIAVSATKIEAMAAYTNGSLERAAAFDPGSYRIRMRLADGYLGKGQCKQARVHAQAAHDLFPESPAPKKILAQCGGAKR
jgi:hypothetical protein